MFEAIRKIEALSASELRALDEDGFVVIDGPVPAPELPALSRAYDLAVKEAAPTDVREGSTTTRVQDFVNRTAVVERRDQRLDDRHRSIVSAHIAPHLEEVSLRDMPVT